jgi:predicted DNA-binding transcriptional regulator AlpA
MPVTPSTRPVPAHLRERSNTRPGFSPELFDRLWDIHDVAAFIDASEATAWRNMNRADAPERLFLGTKTVRWDPTAVVEFLLSRTKQTSSSSRDQSGRDRARTLKVVQDPDRVTVITPQRPHASTTVVAMRPSTHLNRRGGRS